MGAGSRDHVGADDQVDRDILVGLDAFCQIAGPGFEVVDPGAHRVEIAPQLPNGKRAPPAVIDQGLHGGFDPSRLVLFPIEEHARDRVMAVGKHIGFDGQRVADDAFDGECAVVDPRRDILDDDSRPSVFNWHGLILL